MRTTFACPARYDGERCGGTMVMQNPDRRDPREPRVYSCGACGRVERYGLRDRGPTSTFAEPYVDVTFGERS